MHYRGLSYVLYGVLLALPHVSPAAALAQKPVKKDGITWKKDDFEGVERVYTDPIKLDGKKDAADITLIIQKFTEKAGAPSYQLFIRYSASDWLFIRPGESLVMLVDSTRLGLTSENGSSSSRDVGYGGRITELAMYELTPADLAKIASAQSVRLKISGNRYYAERTFGEETFKSVRAFLSAVDLKAP